MRSDFAKLSTRPFTRLVVVAFSLASCLGASHAATQDAAAEVIRAYVSEVRRPVAPGVFHDRGTLETDTAGRQAVNLLEIDVDDPVIAFEASLSNDRVAGLERTTLQANRRNHEGHRVVGAVNADFYDTGGSAAPTGIHIQWNDAANMTELVTFGPNARPTFGILPDGQPILHSPRVTATVTTPYGAWPIARLNQSRASGQLVLYTSRFAASTGTTSAGTEVVVGSIALPLGPQGVYSGTVREVRRAAGSTPIDEDEVVLSGSGAAVTTFLDALESNDSIAISLSITAGWEDVVHAVGGSHFIVRNGAVVPAANDGFSNVTHPRTAIAITADGDVVMATVDGRQPGYSIGVRLDELGELLHSRGAVDAINLDGGGSTTMAVRRSGEDGVSLANRPSDAGGERAVSNSLLVVSSAPTGPLAIANVVPPDVTALVGTSIDYSVKGQDAAYNAVAIDPSNIRWSLRGRAGRIDDSGGFTARRAGSSTIRAKIGRVTGETHVAVVDTVAELEVHPSYTALDTGETQAFTFVARSGETDVHVGPGLAAWQVIGSIGRVDIDGVFTAEAGGTGSVHASVGGATGSALVDVDRPPEVLEDFEDISDVRALAVAGTAMLSSATDPDPVYFGNRSARLAYYFNASGPSAAYATHAQAPPSPPTYREMSGRPRKIGVWVYGDDSRHWLRGNYREGPGKHKWWSISPLPPAVERRRLAANERAGSTGSVGGTSKRTSHPTRGCR